MIAMRIMILLISVAAVSAAAGMAYEEERIQDTCESYDAPTIIRGTTYLCFSQKMIQQMRDLAQRRKQA